MLLKRRYEYDPDSCSFVRSQPSFRGIMGRISLGLVLVLSVTLLFVFAVDLRFVETPEEIALAQENAVLQAQLQETDEKLSAFRAQMSELSRVDQELYRTLLQADPVSDDILQVGVGGSDRYAGFDRYSGTTSSLLRKTAAGLDELERQIELQNESYRNLFRLASQNERWMMQIPAILPSEGPIVSGFGLRMHPLLKVRRMHNGVDILVRTGTPVVSTGDGVVYQAGRSASFGRFIRIKHPATGYITLYAHLSRIEGNIQPGRSVSRGQVIGYSGNTGLSKAPHLHYEVLDESGKAYDPIYFFAPGLTPTEFQSLKAASDSSVVSFD